MDGYLQIYTIILVSGMLSSLICRKCFTSLNKSYIVTSLIFSTIYYYVIAVFRTMAGNGKNLLGFSFGDKTVQSYVKVVCLEIVVFAMISILLKIREEIIIRLCTNTVAAFASLELMYIVLVDLPNMYVTLFMGIAAVIIGILTCLYDAKKKKMEYFVDKSSIRDKYLLLGSQIVLFGVLFLLNGPTELYAYNQDNFMFSYSAFIFYMLIFFIGMVVVYSILIVNLVKGKAFDILCAILFLYSALSYVQTMFLNGDMSTINGVTQDWTFAVKMINIAVWLVIAGIFLFIFFKTKYGNKVMFFSSVYVVAIQMVTFVVLICTTGVFSGQKAQLSMDGWNELSSEENVVVFILDAYDVQYIDKVLEDDEAYLEKLKDFTFYNNMESRFLGTDGSLPYLLTGVKSDLQEEEAYRDYIYDTSTFLKDIRNVGYDLRILTETQYVEPFEEKVVDNYTDSYYCVLDFGKAVSGMARCIRYRGVPFVLKNVYHYETYDLTNMIENTDLYLFGTDAEFDEKINAGLSVSDLDKAMRIYHLYGAHSPYYLTENATLDYGSNPMAQWKGSLKIVYDYIDKLKEKGLYENTAIIIMADHGLNDAHWTVMDEWNISVNKKTNPIFFLKKRGETHDEMEVNNVESSHDDFFPTIIKLIDENNSSYGKAIWEK